MPAPVLPGAAPRAWRQFLRRRRPPVRLCSRPEPGQGEEHAEPQVSLSTGSRGEAAVAAVGLMVGAEDGNNSDVFWLLLGSVFAVEYLPA